MISDNDVPEGDKEQSILKIPIWRLEGLSYILTIIGALLGAISITFGVYQYWQSLDEARAGRTLELVTVWDEQRVFKAYNRLVVALDKSLEMVSSEDRSAAEQNTELASQIYEKLTRRILRNPDRSEDFDTVVHFFTRLAICVEAELCSESASNAFFDDTIATFRNRFNSEFEKRRNRRPNFGEPIDKFLSRSIVENNKGHN